MKESAEAVYALYPKKVGKKAALRAILRSMGDCAVDRLLERTGAYAKAVAGWPPEDRIFIPHPATWFNRGSYDDDPAEWIRLGRRAPGPSWR